MHYLQGDAPAAPILVVPTRDGDPVELEDYSSVTATLQQPDGTDLVAAASLVEEEGQRVVQVALPQLDQAGVLQLVLLLTGPTGHDRFTAEPVVVEALDGWHTLESARAEAKGLAALEDVRLYVLLDAAKRDCLTYQPAAGARRPLLAEREAQLVQTRNRNAAARVDPASGSDGMDTFGTTPFPLDWQVKALLRPKRRLGAIR